MKEFRDAIYYILLDWTQFRTLGMFYIKFDSTNNDLANTELVISYLPLYEKSS